MFSDGYPDQFSEKTNKKFKIRNFRQLISHVADWGMDRQKEHIEKIFNEWKGSAIQVDDVLVMGFEI